MSNILAIDTTLGGCSVALSSGPARRIEQRNQQTSQLAALVDAVMQEADLTFPELDAYAVTTGPGSFTGVRIGLAFMRGLALAEPKPIHAISTLQLLAWQALEAGAEGPVLSAINAYRGQVYLQSFSADNGRLSTTDNPQAVELEALPQGEFTLAGDAGEFFPAHNPLATLPDAAALARYALTLPLPDTKQKPAPLYLRAPDAKAQKGDLTVAQ